ncbi:MAG TPA: PDZ domain-containing protein [Candidatus Acidoferrales bacterium]|nr:PDZ domain-containing protein [Candidatus Acidoferrales bacterium]
MRVGTYLKYAALGAMAMGLTIVGVTAQEVPVTPAPSTPQANENCDINIFDSAQFQKEMAQMQRRIQESLRQVQARASLYGAEVAREMTENGMKSEELANLTAEARNSAQQARQLFGQSVLLDSDEGTGWLGLEMTEITAERAKELNLNPVRGVQVTEILPDGPAAKAGLQTNDVIVQYDGHDVEGTVQFRRLVRETPPGRSVPIAVLRAGHEQKMTIQVGNRAKSLESEWHEGAPLALSVPSQAYNFKMEMPELFMGMTPTLGIEAEDVTGQLGAYFKVPGDDGVLVRSVSKDTPAAKAGLKAGDVITRVDGLTVTTLAELRVRLREKREEKTVSLMVMRQGAPVSVTVTLETPQPEPARTRSAAL